MFGCVSPVVIVGSCLILPIPPARTSHGNISSFLEHLSRARSWDIKVSTGGYGTFSQGAHSLVGAHKTAIGMTEESPVTVNVLSAPGFVFSRCGKTAEMEKIAVKQEVPPAQFYCDIQQCISLRRAQ